MLELILRILVIGAFATGAALLFERALIHARLGARYAWTFALLATGLLPWLPEFATTALPAVVPQVTAPAIVLTATSNLAASFSVNLPLLIWLSLSACVSAYYLIAFMRLRRAQRSWQLAQLAGHEVYMSREFGPAVFGFASPRIVVPAWVGTTSPDEQQLIVLHEREHIKARDHLQLLLTMAATIALPWNPFAWLQARKLRFRVETDCDQRVLHTMPDAARYAALLVDVGSRQNGLLLMPALAEHRNGLETRLTMLANRLIENRWKAAGLAVAGVVLMLVACEARLPNDPPVPTAQPSEADAAERSLPRSRSTIPPVLGPDISELIVRHYPPLLRAAGIGGTVKVQARVHPDGTVDGYQVPGSSGHKALDEAGLKVVRAMRILPTRVPSGQVPQTVTETFDVVFDPNMKVRTLQPTPAPTNQRLPMKSLNPDDGPQFTPFDEMPQLTNRDAVMTALARNYPPLLRDAGIGGTTIGWALVDKSGKVTRTQIKQGSGRAELDAAALKVLQGMQFEPARHQGERVSVWIALPIVFRVE
jgi:TonB family protein